MWSFIAKPAYGQITSLVNLPPLPTYQVMLAPSAYESAGVEGEESSILKREDV